MAVRALDPGEAPRPPATVEVGLDAAAHAGTQRAVALLAALLVAVLVDAEVVVDVALEDPVESRPFGVPRAVDGRRLLGRGGALRKGGSRGRARRGPHALPSRPGSERSRGAEGRAAGSLAAGSHGEVEEASAMAATASFPVSRTPPRAAPSRGPRPPLRIPPVPSPGLGGEPWRNCSSAARTIPRPRLSVLGVRHGRANRDVDRLAVHEDVGPRRVKAPRRAGEVSAPAPGHAPAGRTIRGVPRGAIPVPTRYQPEVLRRLHDGVRELWESTAALERDLAADLERVAPQSRASARNLVHYLAVRRHDIRSLQVQLGHLGLSSLGRIEAHVTAGLESVLLALSRIADKPLPAVATRSRPTFFREGDELLARHTDALLGPARTDRQVRIVVTLPTEAAWSYGLVRELVAAGMDVARVNAAHDDPAAWERMVGNVRAAEVSGGGPRRAPPREPRGGPRRRGPTA